ncbi:MAG TPA: class I adenylate-forming enzyme family protein [Terriglobales bacterium]
MSAPERLELTLQDFEDRFGDRHLLHGVVEKWAREKPSEIALIDSERGKRTTWAEFESSATALALHLLRLGFNKGDCFASLLPLTSEHLFIEYACFKLGCIFVPLDLRLPSAEILRSLRLVNAKGFAFLKVPGIQDIQRFTEDVRSQLELKAFLQLGAPTECVEGATPLPLFLREAATSARNEALIASYRQISVRETDGALVIFTTGSTGSPKPALLSHRNISCQAMCISQALLHGQGDLVTLVNLPPSHVGCQTELLMGTVFEGGTAVLVSVFDPAKSLQAIQDYRVTALGQIPAMFQFEWRLKNYDTHDLSSLDFAAYGGQQVSAAFIDKMATMAPNVGTGLGLTETAGFCTYIRRDAVHASDCVTTLGWAMPIYPMTIRAAMKPDGSAGEELAPGELGHVCFRGPQTFLGYINDPAATAAAISGDGYLYTGDIGSSHADGLHMAGRAKLVIKSGGYQVFPGDIENHFCRLDEVASCAVVGVEHPILSEVIVAFIEKKPGVELTQPMLEKHARGLATYMRPRNYVVLETGEIPLNRVAKADYMVLRERAKNSIRD